MPERRRARILVWSDYVCPFCYLQEPVLERVREEYGSRVGIEWKAFELRPEPIPTLDPDGEYLHRVWNSSVYPMAERRGMTLRLPPVQPRSRRALEAAEAARAAGRFDAMHHALFRAFFEDGRDIGDVEVLLDIGRSVGLDRDELRSALVQGRFTDHVLADQRQAHELGITGVPAMVVAAEGAALDRAELVMGAQPFEHLRVTVERVLERVPDGAEEEHARQAVPVFRLARPGGGE